jgi:hypothetical protein
MARVGSSLLLAAAFGFMPFLAAVASDYSAEGTKRDRIVIPAPPAPQITSQAQAEAVLHDHGITTIRRLGQIGDYWEGEGLASGVPVAAYVFANGTLWIRNDPPALLTQAFGELPYAQQTATAP